MRILLALAVFVCASFASAPSRADAPVPRVILALYDSNTTKIKFSSTHQFAEMPLNHLGLTVRYHDIRQPLPPLSEMGDVRGVLTFFRGIQVPDPDAYIVWAENVIRAGKKFVVMGTFGIEVNRYGQPFSRERLNKFLSLMGLRSTGEFVYLTYDYKVVAYDKELLGFEYPMPGILPEFDRLQAAGADTKILLSVRRNDDPASEADLIVTSPTGGYASSEYARLSDNDRQKRAWFINPFEFFRIVFATDDLPKPDTTTLSGRRMYYSHIDGDGWRNYTLAEGYSQDPPTLSMDVLIKEIIQGYSDLPVSVAPIAADLDPDWYGDETMQDLAKRAFAEPNVEEANHSYSHPFDWGFFVNWTPEKEKPFLKYYPPRPMQAAGGLFNSIRMRDKRQMSSWVAGESASDDTDDPALKNESLKGYKVPRAYAVKPYDVQNETKGAKDYIDRFSQNGKKVVLYQWSGNTSPAEDVIAATRAAGMRNINGGDTRFDAEFPSYAWVAAVGVPVGKQRQIYSSTSNENTYTELWSNRFFGYRYLQTTLRNTETPIRVKPINLYYHVYTGDKTASINALKGVLDYVRSQEVAPVHASRFAAIADSFYDVRVVGLNDGRWRIENRGDLQTIRFDHATMKAVDYARSEGVIGERHFQGSLYIALDEANSAPVIALKEAERADTPSNAARPYLISARWRVWNLKLGADKFEFAAQGFGDGEMAWKVPRPGRYRVTLWKGNTQLETADVIATPVEKMLRTHLGAQAIDDVRVEVVLVAGG